VDNKAPGSNIGTRSARNDKARLLTAVAAICMATWQGFPAYAAEPAPMPRTITIPVYFLSAAGEPATPAAIPEDLTIELGAIAGSLGGNPDARVQTIRVGRKSQFQLNLAELSVKLGAHAARFSERGGVPIQLKPTDARFARGSSLVSTGAGPLAGLAVVFWDPQANGSLVPLYCDRPCGLRAPELATDTFEFDSQVPGLVWMLTTRGHNSRFVHARALDPRPVLVIAPPEALQKITPSTFRKR
jgi:hypothetical protein